MQASAVPEHGGAQPGQAGIVRELHLAQTGAAGKGGLADLAHVRADVDFFQGLAAAESAGADVDHAAADLDGLDRHAAVGQLQPGQEAVLGFGSRPLIKGQIGHDAVGIEAVAADLHTSAGLVQHRHYVDVGGQGPARSAAHSDLAYGPDVVSGGHLFGGVVGDAQLGEEGVQLLLQGGGGGGPDALIQSVQGLAVLAPGLIDLGYGSVDRFQLRILRQQLLIAGQGPVGIAQIEAGRCLALQGLHRGLDGRGFGVMLQRALIIAVRHAGLGLAHVAVKAGGGGKQQEPAQQQQGQDESAQDQVAQRLVGDLVRRGLYVRRFGRGGFLGCAFRFGAGPFLRGGAGSVSVGSVSAGRLFFRCGVVGTGVGLIAAELFFPDRRSFLRPRSLFVKLDRGGDIFYGIIVVTVLFRLGYRCSFLRRRWLLCRFRRGQGLTAGPAIEAVIGHIFSAFGANHASYLPYAGIRQ